MKTIAEIIKALELLGIKVVELRNNKLQLTMPDNIDKNLAKEVLPKDWYENLFVKEKPKPIINYHSSKSIKTNS